jgi:hypothetical protein
VEPVYEVPMLTAGGTLDRSETLKEVNWHRGFQDEEATS